MNIIIVILLWLISHDQTWSPSYIDWSNMITRGHHGRSSFLKEFPRHIRRGFFAAASSDGLMKWVGLSMSKHHSTAGYQREAVSVSFVCLIAVGLTTWSTYVPESRWLWFPGIRCDFRRRVGVAGGRPLERVSTWWYHWWRCPDRGWQTGGLLQSWSAPLEGFNGLGWWPTRMGWWWLWMVDSALNKPPLVLRQIACDLPSLFGAL